MSVTQAVLPLPRQAPPRVRACRRPFVPTPPAGPYRLPRAVLERLAVTLAPYRNRDAALALAVFLARYHSAPRKLGLPFPVDRRAIAERSALDLTEARVRGAVATLEAVGFLDRADGRRRFQATADGLHRRPILFSFGLDALTAFRSANARAIAAAERAAGGRRAPASISTPTPAPRPSCDPLITVRSRSPKDTCPPESVFLMGEVERGSAGPRVASTEPLNSGLSAALARLGASIIGDKKVKS